MAKKTIILTESELNRLICESVKTVLNEVDDADTPNIGDIDISKIDIEILKSAYRDWRLTPTWTSYDDVLSDDESINEAVGDIMPPDDVVNKIVQRYQLPTQLIGKIEANHKIYIYVIIALVGDNAKLIQGDMTKMGYFLGFKGKVQQINGMSYQKMQFEPTSQLQEDITDKIKSEYNSLYHWTPMYCVEGIRQKGLIPDHKNEMFDYPPRTYLMGGDSDEQQMFALGQKLCAKNNNPNNTGLYALLGIEIKNLDENIRFYYDPNSAIGVYTEQVIPSDKVELVQTVQFVKSLKRP